ncbi:hypothetical protein [Demequina oxidasica]|uniref:hypothetical protein n=1 Tax=Demequina oxidasica TaxID=676199 RepID=UPI00078474D8|nr:hypothetical protein [Demequina oxidasica]
MSSTAVRPGSVTLVVVLMWLSALGSAVGGGLLLWAVANPSSATADGDGALYGWISLGIGLFMAILAVALSGGSRLVRFLVILTMTIRAVLDIYALVKVDDANVPMLVASLLFALGIIALLTTKRASAFFRR